MRFNSNDSFEVTRRLTPIILIFFLLLLVIASKVLYLQLVMGEELRKQSQVNRIQHEILPARRGPILDRNGKVLAADEPVFNLVKRGSLIDTSDTALRTLARGLQVETERFLEQARGRNVKTVLNGLTDKQKIWFAEQSRRFPTFEIKVRPRRVYRFGSITAPVLGYTGEISPQQLAERRKEGLYQGQYVGKAGIEKFYDSTLQGNDGIRWVETTATGERIRVLDSPKPIPPRAGDSVTLNLDIFLQQAVASSFPSDSHGAAIVMELPKGKIRALFSHPSYDPNKMVSGVQQTVNKLLHAPGDPLHNRVVQSRFPPGSTFKTIPYLSALKSSDYPSDHQFRCPGEFQLGDHTFKCWEKEGHGELALHQAVVHSCNVYFYKLIRKLGFAPMRRMAFNLGFNQRTGIDLPDEVAPQLSTPKLKQELTGRDWVEGDALNAVIGQGYTLISPIKQAQLLGSIITGNKIQPGIKQDAAEIIERDYVPYSDSIRNRFIETLDQVTDNGTGYWAQHDQNYQSLPVDIIGKTGTVQQVKRDDEGDTPPSDAWFISAAPKDDPRYVVVVYLSESGSGGTVAAPHARRIYEEMLALGYFNRSRPKESISKDQK
jgi:penicillin-binding protein 2